MADLPGNSDGDPSHGGDQACHEKQGLSFFSNQDSRWKIATYSIFQDGSTPAPDLDGQVCAHDDGRSLSFPQRRSR